jgi:hypothetical protein
MSSTLSFQIAAALMGFIFPAAQEPQSPSQSRPQPQHQPQHQSRSKPNHLPAQPLSQIPSETRTPPSPRTTTTQSSHAPSSEEASRQRGEGRRSTETTPLLGGQVFQKEGMMQQTSGCGGVGKRRARARVVWPLLGSV